MKVRDMMAHLDAQIGTRSMEGLVKDERKSPTRAQAWSQFKRELAEMKEGEQITKKLEGEITALFPMEQVPPTPSTESTDG